MIKSSTEIKEELKQYLNDHDPVNVYLMFFNQLDNTQNENEFKALISRWRFVCGELGKENGCIDETFPKSIIAFNAVYNVDVNKKDADLNHFSKILGFDARKTANGPHCHLAQVIIDKIYKDEEAPV